MGGDAGKNDHFVALLNCMVEHDCMEKYGESGSCLAEDSQALDTKARSQQNYQKLDFLFHLLRGRELTSDCKLQLPDQAKVESDQLTR